MINLLHTKKTKGILSRMYGFAASELARHLMVKWLTCYNSLCVPCYHTIHRLLNAVLTREDVHLGSRSKK